MYEPFNKYSSGTGIKADDIKHLFNKALESKLMIETMLVEKRKRFYDVSGIIQVTKKARMHKESE
eukprot:1741418-Ditylum_brightwellii.AAC.1